MPADSLAVFSQHWNMWKKLVFYISQLVASSADWPVTPHRDPNAHKGSVPNELTAFPGRGERARQGGREGGGTHYGRFMFCHARQKVPGPFNTHGCVLRHTHTPSARWGGCLRSEPDPVSEIADQKMSCTTPHPAPPKPTWRLRCICIQIRSFCITSGANYGAQMGEITSRLRGAIGRTTLT